MGFEPRGSFGGGRGFDRGGRGGRGGARGGGMRGGRGGFDRGPPERVVPVATYD